MRRIYPARYRVQCACGWFAEFYDLHVADGAAEWHERLKPGHRARLTVL